MKLDPKILRDAATALIRAHETNLGYELSMPLLYPAGDTVSVTVSIAEGFYIVHDCGNGTMHLSAEGVNLTRGIKERLKAVAASYGCDFLNGRVQTRATQEQLAAAIAYVANASKSVGEEVSRRAYKVTLREKVTNSIMEIAGKRLRTNEQIFGQSGKKYHVSNVLLDALQRKPIAFIEPVPSEATVAQRFMEFSDIAAANDNVTREAVYDDEIEWEPEDLNLLQTVAQTVPYSRADSLFKRIIAAK